MELRCICIEEGESVKYYPVDIQGTERYFMIGRIGLELEVVFGSHDWLLCICFHFDNKAQFLTFRFLIFSIYSMLIIIPATVTSLAIMRLVVFFLKVNFS